MKNQVWTAPRTAVGYARSNGSDEEQSVSLESQVAAIERYAAFRELELEAVICDKSVSGSMPIEAREGGARLIERLYRPNVGVDLLVVRLERLFSSAAECVDCVDALAPQGTVLHVLDLEGSAISTGSPAGRTMMAVLRSARDMEQEQTRHRAQTIMKARKARKGIKPLLGEKIVRGYIVPDPTEMHAIKRIEQLANQGKSLRLIAEALDHEGVPTKRRAKAWSKEAIRLILRRIEKGEVRSLRTVDLRAPYTDAGSEAASSPVDA
jgi:site-specific DNA recombinase